MKKIYWISKTMWLSCVFFSIFITTIMFMLTLFGDDLPIVMFLFGWIVSIFCIFSCIYLSYLGVTLDFDKEIIIFHNFRDFKIGFDDVDTIKVHILNILSSNKHCIVRIYLKDGKSFDYINCFTLCSNKTVEFSRKKVELINKQLKIKKETSNSVDNL